jgi:hypothetical protein
VFVELAADSPLLVRGAGKRERERESSVHNVAVEASALAVS